VHAALQPLRIITIMICVPPWLTYSQKHRQTDSFWRAILVAQPAELITAPFPCRKSLSVNIPIDFERSYYTNLSRASFDLFPHPWGVGTLGRTQE